MANPLDMVKEHPVATMVVVGGVGGAALVYYLLSRGSSASTGTATTTQTLTPAPSSGGSGVSYGNQNNSLLQAILANQLSGMGSGISPTLTGSGSGSGTGLFQPSGQPLQISKSSLAPTTSPSTTVPNAYVSPTYDAQTALNAITTPNGSQLSSMLVNTSTGSPTLEYVAPPSGAPSGGYYSKVMYQGKYQQEYFTANGVMVP